MAGKRADMLVKMLNYESYISINQLRNDLGVSNSSNNEDYILFRQTIKDAIKDLPNIKDEDKKLFSRHIGQQKRQVAWDDSGRLHKEYKYGWHGKKVKFRG